MSRLPRRSKRIKPPLRGRLAASLSPERQRDYSIPVTRPRPSIATRIKPKSIQEPVRGDILDNLEQPIEPIGEITPPVSSVPSNSLSTPEDTRTLNINWLIGLSIALALFLLLNWIHIF